jgi:hypothetical protein
MHLYKRLPSILAEMKEEKRRGDECLSLFPKIPCETMRNLYSGQNILARVTCLQESYRFLLVRAVGNQ